LAISIQEEPEDSDPDYNSSNSDSEHASGNNVDSEGILVREDSGERDVNDSDSEGREDNEEPEIDAVDSPCDVHGSAGDSEEVMVDVTELPLNDSVSSLLLKFVRM